VKTLRDSERYSTHSSLDCSGLPRYFGRCLQYKVQVLLFESLAEFMQEHELGGSGALWGAHLGRSDQRTLGYISCTFPPKLGGLATEYGSSVRRPMEFDLFLGSTRTRGRHNESWN